MLQAEHHPDQLQQERRGYFLRRTARPGLQGTYVSTQSRRHLLWIRLSTEGDERAKESEKGPFFTRRERKVEEAGEFTRLRSLKLICGPTALFAGILLFYTFFRSLSFRPRVAAVCIIRAARWFFPLSRRGFSVGSRRIGYQRSFYYPPALLYYVLPW